MPRGGGSDMIRKGSLAKNSAGRNCIPIFKEIGLGVHYHHHAKVEKSGADRNCKEERRRNYSVEKKN